MTMRTGATLAAVVIMAMACGDGTTPLSPDVVKASGRYGLTTVNDSVLPRTVQTRTNYTLEITSDTIVLNADGSWADGTNYRETDAGVVRTSVNYIGGNFTVSSTGAVAFHSNAGTFSGTLNGNTLTVEGPTAKAVYRK
jgi:hypothetical protein